mgnify:CR=1 FL=1
MFLKLYNYFVRGIFIFLFIGMTVSLIINPEIIEDENDMKSIDTEEEEYIAGKTDKFGSYRFIEGEYTQERINNFNDNMKHIRLWDYDEKNM